MHLIEDTAEGFTATRVRDPLAPRYKVGLPWGAVRTVHGDDRITDHFYRDYVISYNPKPIPTRAFDYDYVHIDFDGAPDANDNRCGSCESALGCRSEIDIKYDEGE